MIKKHFNKLDLDLYEETLDNGLKIFVIPFNNVSNTYITLSTKYGSIERTFVPYGEDEYVTVPDGVAHFLEHKVFEQKDGKDPFEYFSERGADANANTSNFKTTYLFSGSKYLEDNLNYLLNYVYSPYFTEENVEKEKGIIIQEMKMYEDNPYSVMYENINYNTFVNHPIKIRVIGNEESVNSITKEDLYTCYNTFYKPSNMFLVASGNVNPENIVNIVKKNMALKKFGKQEKIKVKKYREPSNVYKEKESIKMNLTIPKVGIGYKINIKDIKLPHKEIIEYISLFFEIKFGPTSIINEELEEKGIITEDLYLSTTIIDNYVCIYVLGETKEIDKFYNSIKKCIKDTKISKKDFDRKIHASYADLISMSDNIYSMNNKVMNNYVRYGKVETNDYGKINKLSYDKFIDTINKLDFSNYLTYTIEPK